MTAAVVRHPRFAELVARRMLRGKIERAVERLLAVLDEIDGDADLEPEEDLDDTEAGELDTADLEPSLGAAEIHHAQRAWHIGSRDDREYDPAE